ncbi:M23 family metallopeptidase [Pinirhizobacter sp.]|jgi:LasA protease|uniref:M23 family metallopeptidase n=1 Tax=Pinirhizobacter sp. TaxID=2950432 RepID=UPI002F40BC29
MYRKTLRAALALAVLAGATGVHASTDVPVDLQRAAIDAFVGSDTAALSSLGAPSDSDLLVEVMKQDASSQYVMGSVTRKLPLDVHGTPPTAFFFAHRAADGWKLGMSGQEAFLDELEAMPESLLSSDERRVWASNHAVTAEASLANHVGIGLPWPVNQGWQMTAGIHGDSGSSRPFNSVDLWSSNGRVLVPTAGNYYVTCRARGSALVHILHDNGYETTYYHMENMANIADGTRVETGTFLGYVGNALPCGGSSSGAHVHMSLKYNGRATPLDGSVLGGWTFHESWFPYQGYLSRGNQRINPGSRTLVTNYGEDDPGI